MSFITNDIQMKKDYKKQKEKKFLVNVESTDMIEEKGKKWTKEEDEILAKAVSTYEEKNWEQISEMVKNRSSIQCLQRWKKILMPGIVKGPWTYHEDRKLLNWIKKEGPTKWSICASTIPGRSGKQCRERWFNALNPNVKKGDWTPEEDYSIYLLYGKHGGKWSAIALSFEQRTENSIKNRFYSSLRKRHSESKKNEKDTAGATSTNETNKEKIPVGIDELLKYLPRAIEVTAQKLMKKNHFSRDDLKAFEQDIIQKSSESLISKKTKKSHSTQKDEYISSSETMTLNLDNNKINQNFIESEVMIPNKNDSLSDNELEDDLMNLEKEINQICNCNEICNEKMDMSIDMDKLLKINSEDGNSPFLDEETEKIEEIETKGQEDVYGYLLVQLKDLETLVQNTKSELLKYTTCNKNN